MTKTAVSTQKPQNKPKAVASVQRMVMAGVCLALCLVLPFLTGQIPEIGSKLSPMHIPVLLCGLTCGWPWALAVGFIAPPLRFLLFGMPPIFPTGVGMMFELAAYGAIAGLMVTVLPRKNWALYAALIVAMIGGRLVWGAVRWALTMFGSGAFTFQAFLAGAVIDAWPGIICHILIVPPLAIALRKAGFGR